MKKLAENKEYVSLRGSQIKHGIKFMPDLISDTSDRNRTSPFAFTGSKFEFRMPGSSLNVSCVNTVLNTAVADAISHAISQLGNKPDESKIKSVIKEMYKQHHRILFGGNGYSLEWQKEAQKRKLLNLTNTADALACYDTPKNIALFERHGILNEIEIKARQHILFEEYCKHIKIESLTMLDLVNREIIPAVIKYQSKLTTMSLNKKQLGVNFVFEKKLLSKINNLLTQLDDVKTKMIDDLAKLRDVKEIQKRAKFYQIHICADMKQMREVVDNLERLMPKNIWPMPTYADILFYL